MREGFSHFSLHVRVVMDLSCIAKLHSTRHLFITIINTVVLRLSCMSVPPIAHVVAPCFVWPFLTSLSLSSPVCLISLPMSFYQRIMRVCVSVSIFVNADDSVPPHKFFTSDRFVTFGNICLHFQSRVEQIYHATFVY